LVDCEVFDRRLARLETLLRGLRKIANKERDAFLNDEMLQASAERWLQLAAECAIDLAHHLIADRGWKTPATYREAFQVLLQEGAISSEIAHQIEAWAGLRNVLVHLYLDVDQKRIHEILRNDLDQLENYARELSQAVSGDD
jgi:uncharacterized protein YutE (UPF0331/DUF86 family)